MNYGNLRHRVSNGSPLASSLPMGWPPIYFGLRLSRYIPCLEGV